MTDDTDKVSLPAYFEIADAPGLKLFRCAKLSATLSTTACGTNFKRAQHLSPDRVASAHLCRDCPLGAHHAGVPFVRRSALFGLDICPRCRRHSERIIHGTRCVSCFNREREWILGRNAKNTRPTMADLLPRRIRIVLNSEVTELRAERSRDTAEMVLGVLRVAEGRVLFTRPRRGPAVPMPDWIAERRHYGGLSAQLSPQRQRQRAEKSARARQAQPAEAVAASIERRAAGIAPARQHTAREARG
jgi:hypothetical protein